MADAFPTRAAIASSQLTQLRGLLNALVPANTFYTQKLASVGVRPAIASLDDFFQRFPFTFKRELVEDQKSHPPYGTNLTFALDRYTRCHQTSGSAGAPLRWLDTPENWEWMLNNWAQVYKAAGVTKADRIFFAFSFGPFIGFWLAFETGLRLGCLCLPGGGMGSTARLRAILEHRVTVICCTPTYAIHLAEVAAKEKIDLSAMQVETLIVAGEPGGSIPATRARLAQLWRGARVWDHHGMTEVGPVTYECPARPGVLHLIETSYLGEVVEPVMGKPITPGQTGELVLTTLGRTGSPVLRYRTGDLVKPFPQLPTPNSQPCPCGRFDLALDGGILGRTDDMVVVRGVNIYPSAVEEIIRQHGGVAEYQVQVATSNALTELSVNVEPATDCSDGTALAKELEAAFQTAFSLRVPVTLVTLGSLPRFEMKAKRWVKI